MFEVFIERSSVFEKESDMDIRIAECQTLSELAGLERVRPLTEEEQRLVFERKLEIFQRIGQWRAENQQLGLSPDISDNWTPALRERLISYWKSLMK